MGENCRWNRIEDNGCLIGVISSGDCYYYAKEVFGENANYLKIGFSNPLPSELIKTFCTGLKEIYVIEEDDPILERGVRELGFSCHGKNLLPAMGEMTPDVLREHIFHTQLPAIVPDTTKIVARPPTFCAGCPHRGLFYELGKLKNVMVSGDIGCYSLAYSEPYCAIL